MKDDRLYLHHMLERCRRITGIEWIMENAVDTARLDRSVFEIGSLDDDPEEQSYWRTKSPQERMEALELMRQIIYGYDPATTRLQRVLEVAELE